MVAAAKIFPRLVLTNPGENPVYKETNLLIHIGLRASVFGRAVDLLFIVGWVEILYWLPASTLAPASGRIRFIAEIDSKLRERDPPHSPRPNGQSTPLLPG
jgi:hypothetical protein